MAVGRRSIVVGISLVVLGLGMGTARADKVDDYVNEQLRGLKVAGMSVAVVRDGRPVKMRGYGSASIELSAPASEKPVYPLASVTKQFTATAIMMLARDGLLSVDDPISKHLPNLPPAWSAVTIRQLLTHTSGIRNYTDHPDISNDAVRDRTPHEIIKLVWDSPLDFAPGTHFKYSNTGYFLLGMIIEKVSGRSYGDYLSQTIFQPLSMSSTRVDSPFEVIPNRVASYAMNEHGEMANFRQWSPSIPFSAGALASNVPDLVKWDAALRTGRLLSPAVLQQMWTPGVLSNGTQIPYGFGWAIGAVRGHRLVSHSGAGVGSSTNISRYIDDKLTVIVLANTEGVPAESVARGIAGHYIQGITGPQKPARDDSPSVTRRIRRVLLSVAGGAPDRAEFTPAFWSEIFPERLEKSRKLLSSLGSLKTLYLTQGPSPSEPTVYRYYGVFGTTEFTVTATLASDGKLSGLALASDG